MNLRLCRLCNSRVVEDEVHMLFDCDAYADIRANTKWCNLFIGHNSQDMHKFMNQKDQYALSTLICAQTKDRSRKLTLIDQSVDVVDPMLPHGL